MEDQATPWVIAEAVRTSGVSTLWVWAVAALGVAFVLCGGVMYGQG